MNAAILYTYVMISIRIPLSSYDFVVHLIGIIKPEEATAPLACLLSVCVGCQCTFEYLRCHRLNT